MKKSESSFTITPLISVTRLSPTVQASAADTDTAQEEKVSSVTLMCQVNYCVGLATVSELATTKLWTLSKHGGGSAPQPNTLSKKGMDMF